MTSLDDLFDAVGRGHERRARKLLDETPGLVGESSPDGYTPLHVAARSGRGEVVALLLERGADPEAVSHNPLTVRPLHAAVEGGARDCVERLLDANVDIDAKQQGGDTALHLAIAAENEELTELLLGHAADPTLVNDRGQNALDVAVGTGNEKIQALLRRPPQPPGRDVRA